jgi:hypothetical protein
MCCVTLYGPVTNKPQQMIYVIWSCSHEIDTIPQSDWPRWLNCSVRCGGWDEACAGQGIPCDGVISRHENLKTILALPVSNLSSLSPFTKAHRHYAVQRVSNKRITIKRRYILTRRGSAGKLGSKTSCGQAAVHSHSEFNLTHFWP